MRRKKAFLIALIMIVTLLFTSATAFAAVVPEDFYIPSPGGGSIYIPSPIGGGIDVTSPVGGDVVVHNPQPPSDSGWNITDVYGTGIPQGLICVQQPISVEEGLKLAEAIQKVIRELNINVKNQFMINLSLTLNGQPYDQQGKPITFTMIYSGVRPWDKAMIVHIKHDGSYELINAVCGYDQISFTMTSLSPLALLITEGAAAVDSSAINTTVLSPKTNDTNGTSVLWFIAGAAAILASVMGIRRLAKKRSQKM